MAELPDRRWRALVRVRLVLRLAGRLPDLADVLSVRAVRVAQFPAQGPARIRHRPPAAAGIAMGPYHHAVDADRVLSVLCSGGRRRRARRLFAALARTGVLAEWPTVVPGRAPDLRYRGSGGVRRRARRWSRPRAPCR